MNAPIDRGDHLKLARALLSLSGSELVAVVERAERLRRHRLIDPDLRADLERLLPLVEPESIRHEIADALDETHPAAVLYGWWDDLYKARCIERERRPRVSRAEADSDAA